MNRMALLIANTQGLTGTKKDIINMKSFLRSYFGGAWDESEIYKPLQNPSKEYLMKVIYLLKSQNYDYIIVLFSGHGGQRRELLIEINENGERINETELKGIAKRQLTIFDCCRIVLQENYSRNDSILSKSSMGDSSVDIRQIIRRKYDERIMKAIQQQATLYSCSIGQSSYDSNDGAIYLSNLLDAARNISGEFKTVGEAHKESVEPTRIYSLSQIQGEQFPDASLPKCLTEQQLIISINPRAFIRYGLNIRSNI
jgi:hypothetical protein